MKRRPAHTPSGRHLLPTSKVVFIVLALFSSGLIGTASPAHAATAMKPYSIEARFNDEGREGVLLTWDPHGNGGTTQYYTVKLIPRGGCPCKTFERTMFHDIYIPYRSFPRGNRSGGVKIQIRAHGWDGSETVGSSWLKTAAAAYRVSTKRTKAAAQQANSCLKHGRSAAVITAASGTMVLGFSYFVPAVGEVTAAGVAAAAGSIGTATYVACLVGWE